MKRIVYNLFFVIFVVICVSTVKLDAQADSYRYWDGRSWVKASSNRYTSNPIEVTYKVKYCYEEAYKMIDLVNAERRKAGVPELVAKDELMDAAMMRAAETAICLGHIRPDGSSYRSASLFIDGENAQVGSDTAKVANTHLANSPGHYATMTDKRYAYAGYGYVEIYNNDSEWASGCYWVQIFSVADKYHEDGYDRGHPESNKPIQWDSMTIGRRKDYTADFTTKVNPKMISLKTELENQEITVGSVTNGKVYTHFYDATHYYGTSVFLTPDQYNVRIADPDICFWEDGKIKGLKAGTTSIEFWLKEDDSLKTTAQITVKDKPVRKGSSHTVAGNTYKVTDTGKKTVEFKVAEDSGQTVSIPKTVKIQGKTYKVTSIASNAFKDNKKIKAVTIPANITKIGRNAFYGCRNLKKVTVKTTKLTSSKVGKNAFKGIHKQAVIKVPGKKLGTYKKLFKAKGIGKQVKVKK